MKHEISEELNKVKNFKDGIWCATYYGFYIFLENEGNLILFVIPDLTIN